MLCFLIEFKADSPLILNLMNVRELTERIITTAKANGLMVTHYGRMADFDLPVLERKASEEAPHVYIAAGVHGDEPAGPMALLEILKGKTLPQELNYLIFPVINPTGLLAGTRENNQGIDLNRDYGLHPRSYETKAQMDFVGKRNFDLVLCLHEDSDGEGFYIYEHLRFPTRIDYSGLALEAARPHTNIDYREEIDGMPARNGRMHPPEDVLDASRTDLPEALRLVFHHGAKLTFTTETPSRCSIADRILAQTAVVEALLKAFLSERPLGSKT